MRTVTAGCCAGASRSPLLLRGDRERPRSRRAPRACHAVVDRGVLPPWARPGSRISGRGCRTPSGAAGARGADLRRPAAVCRRPEVHSNKILWVSRVRAAPQVRRPAVARAAHAWHAAHRPSRHARRPRRPGAVDHRPAGVGLLARRRLVGAAPRPARPATTTATDSPDQHAGVQDPRRVELALGRAQHRGERIGALRVVPRAVVATDGVVVGDRGAVALEDLRRRDLQRVPGLELLAAAARGR